MILHNREVPTLCTHTHTHIISHTHTHTLNYNVGLSLLLVAVRHQEHRKTGTVLFGGRGGGEEGRDTLQASVVSETRKRITIYGE